MKIWIRSQNKGKLVNVKALSLFDNNVTKNDFVLNNNPDYSNISIIANDNYNLGTYKTKERALEVLEEIQDTLIAKYVTSLNPRAAMLETEEETTKALKKMAVYEMPLD